MRRVLATVLGLQLAIAPLAIAPLARAGSAEDAAAMDLFTQGRELRKKGDCASAVPLFRKSWELSKKGLGSLRNIAECEELLGRFASSRRAWLELSRALLVNADPKYETWAEDARAAAERLAPKVARVTIEITVRSEKGERPLSPTDRVHVLVDGEELDPKLLEVPLDRDPGTFLVRAEGGRVPVEKRVTLVAGATATVNLTVEVPTPGPVPSAPKPETPGSSGSSGARTAGWIALGVGGVAAIGAGVALIVRQGALSELKDSCPQWETGPCPTSLRDTVDRGQTATTMSIVLGATALVGVGVGVGLLWSSPSRSTDHARVRVAPWASASGGGALLTGAF